MEAPAEPCVCAARNWFRDFFGESLPQPWTDAVRENAASASEREYSCVQAAKFDEKYFFGEDSRQNSVCQTFA